MTTNSEMTDTGASVLQKEYLTETFPGYNGEVVASETSPPEDADTVPADEVLPTEIADRLEYDLFTHQAEALQALADGKNVTVATSTSSGKTWIYGLHIAREHLNNAQTTALLVYPTKALTGDQQEALEDLYEELGLSEIEVLKYDGDTTPDVKRYARDNASVILTNFSGLNVYLEQHRRWKRILSNLAVIGIDESHSYGGLQGMHVAWIVRRLRRIVSYYDADPLFVCTSATIGNPGQHTSQLIGGETTVIDDDGSPSGRRDIVFWNPLQGVGTTDNGDDTPDEEELETAQNAAVKLMAHLALEDVQTLAFAQSRQETEISARRLPQAVREHPRRSDEYVDVEPYHAGLGKESRYSVESRLKSGNLDGVFSTSALELGIDIGGVDATILTGYPSSRQSFWQQVGRSGRESSDALSVLITKEEGMDQWIARHPEFLLEDPVEDAVVDLGNDAVFADHVLCAANELPLDTSDTRWFGSDRLRKAVEMWRRAGKMTGTLETGVTYDGGYRPQEDVNLYKSSGTQFEIRCENADIDHEPITRERAYRDYHEGALILHDGKQYEVTEVVEDSQRPHIVVNQVRTNCYTASRGDRTVYDLDVSDRTQLANGYEVCTGMGTVRINYLEYQRREIQTDALKEVGTIDLPPLEMRTELMWIELPTDTTTEYVSRWVDSRADEIDLSPADADNAYLGGLHAAEHGLIKMAPLELRVSQDDLGGMSTPQHPETGTPTIFIYDGVEGGIGFAKSIRNNLTAIADRTEERVRQCDCTGVTGCPACVMSSSCGDDNEPLHTPIAQIVLEALSNHATK